MHGVGRGGKRVALQYAPLSPEVGMVGKVVLKCLSVSDHVRIDEMGSLHRYPCVEGRKENWK